MFCRYHSIALAALLTIMAARIFADDANTQSAPAVQPPIAVEVGDEDAGVHVLRHPRLAGAEVPVHEVEARCGGAVDEAHRVDLGGSR